jgi:hypothetical protein
LDRINALVPQERFYSRVFSLYTWLCLLFSPAEKKDRNKGKIRRECRATVKRRHLSKRIKASWTNGEKETTDRKDLAVVHILYFSLLDRQVRLSWRNVS